MDLDDFIDFIDNHDVIRIDYRGHEYIVSEIEYPSNGNGEKCFDCFCLEKDEEIVNAERTFRIEYIDDIYGSDIEDNDNTSEARLINLSRQYDTLFMGYTNAEGDYHEMNISNIEYPSGQYGKGYFDAFCIDEDGEPEEIDRTFKISRIDFIEPSGDDNMEDDEDD